RAVQLGAGGLAALDEPGCLLGGEAQRVDHAGGTRKKLPSRSGAFASASSTVRQGRGSSSAQTLTTSSGCAVGGTSSRSSSATLETPPRIAPGCSPKRARPPPPP